MLEALLDAENWFPVVTPLAPLVALPFLAVAVRRRVPARRSSSECSLCSSACGSGSRA